MLVGSGTCSGRGLSGVNVFPRKTGASSCSAGRGGERLGVIESVPKLGAAEVAHLRTRSSSSSSSGSDPQPARGMVSSQDNITTTIEPAKGGAGGRGIAGKRGLLARVRWKERVLGQKWLQLCCIEGHRIVCGLCGCSRLVLLCFCLLFLFFFSLSFFFSYNEWRRDFGCGNGRWL